MNHDKLVGDIVTHWLKYGERRRTVAFACGVGHSVHITNEFQLAGIRAEHLDGATPKPQWEFPRLCRGGSKSLTFQEVESTGPSLKL
jgi:hypothetical protein